MRMDGRVTLATLGESLKHGFQTLSHPQWAVASGFRVSVAGLLAMVGVMFVARNGKMAIPTSLPWLYRRENRLEKSFLVPGLQNLENNCFLNVVLQALASCFCFQTFLHNVLQECEIKDLVGSIPLTVALATLLEELNFVSSNNVVLSPHKVMLAMSNYIPNFSLTRQQDAAEAILHLLCSLREEFRDCYAPKSSSLADIFASNCRILTPIQSDWQSEHERWQQLFLGPFDGILGSILTCQSCSSQISMTFESFDCLPLSPVLNDGATIRVGCTIVDCLKQFVVAEHVENYNCSCCWHNAAIKYLSLMDGNETEIEKLRRCSDPEYCDCQKLHHLQNLPWSNRLSHTLKQLSISRCPRILCIQLKRVFVNGFGEPLKLQGHISFPLILDVFPFMTTRLGVKIREADVVKRLPVELQNNGSDPLRNIMQSERILKLNGIYRAAREQINSNDLVDDRFVSSKNVQPLLGGTLFPCSGGSSESIQTVTHLQPTNKEYVSCDSVSQETCLYQLVSVVEHFGRAGSGHYTVYRRVRVKSSDDFSDDQFNPTPMQWFCISDSQVRAVSEEEVFSAEASMLFYERIPKN